MRWKQSLNHLVQSFLASTNVQMNTREKQNCRAIIYKIKKFQSLHTSTVLTLFWFWNKTKQRLGKSMPKRHKQRKSNYHILYSGQHQQHGVPFDFLKKMLQGSKFLQQKQSLHSNRYKLILALLFVLIAFQLWFVFGFFVTFLEPYFTECVFHSYKIAKQK